MYARETFTVGVLLHTGQFSLAFVVRTCSFILGYKSNSDLLPNIHNKTATDSTPTHNMLRFPPCLLKLKRTDNTAHGKAVHFHNVGLQHGTSFYRPTYITHSTIVGNCFGSLPFTNRPFWVAFTSRQKNTWLENSTVS